MSNPSASALSSKLGRKGDSRMHKAVTARLADPEISLFDALKIGGFDYPSREDTSVVDCENVSLGQRKNQLSRRLRLTRKQQPKVGDGSEDHISLSSTSGSAGALSTSAQRELQRLMTQNSKPSAKNKIGARALQMKRAHPELPDISDDDMNIVAQDDEQARRPRIAKFHPDYNPLFVPATSSVRNGNTGGKSSAEAPDQPNDSGTAPNVNALNTMGFGGMVPGFSPGSALSQATLFTQQLANPFAAQQGQSRPSSVAVSSLTHSAHVVGMTLEQLAMTLASNTTSLAKVLADSNAADAQSKKMDLALRLFETDSKALYAKSMLMSGHDPRDCQPNTQAYQDFAVKAWQNEGKRLKNLMGTSFNFPLDFDKATGQSPNDSEHHHSHNHKHDGCDSRHIHRIDGQCGHKAIIHKPKDGNAHIDFVVGNKVECYDGIDPVGANMDAAWPSRFKCSEAGDHGKYDCKLLPDADVPKMIAMSEINLQDPEWNYDVSGSIDGGVAGLFRLGGRSDEAASVL